MANNFLNFKHSGVVFIMLIKVKMPTVNGYLTFMGMRSFILSLVEHDFYDVKLKSGGHNTLRQA